MTTSTSCNLKSLHAHAETFPASLQKPLHRVLNNLLDKLLHPAVKKQNQKMMLHPGHHLFVIFQPQFLLLLHSILLLLQFCLMSVQEEMVLEERKHWNNKPFAESRDKNLEVQSQILKLLQSQESANERTTYADWCKQVMVDLQPSLWRQFQQEQTNLILRYCRLNDHAQRSSAPLPQQSTQQSSIPSPQHSFTHPSTSQQQQQWQPPPPQWPLQVTPAPNVLHSQSTDWVARQFQDGEVATYTTSAVKKKIHIETKQELQKRKIFLYWTCSLVMQYIYFLVG